METAADPIGQLRRTLEELATTDFASFKDATEAPLASLLADLDLKGSCVTVLETLASDPSALGPRPSSLSPATLVNASGAVRIELPPLEPKRGSLFGSAVDCMYGVLAGEVRVTRWRHDDAWDPNVLAPELTLASLPDRACGPGETICAEAWRDVVELSGSAVVLVLRSAPRYPVLWRYDRASLRPKGLIAATEQLARLEEALNILVRLGTAEDADACATLARHESHAIRWAAVRVACQVGHASAYQLLEAARHDPHPEVRRSAEQALSAAAAEVR